MLELKTDISVFSGAGRIRGIALAAALLTPLAILSGCGVSQSKMAQYSKTYSAVADHKAMFLNTDNDRFVWVSGKGTQLDAIQLAQILCTHSSTRPEDCVLVYVDNHQLYDPVDDEAIPPDSPDLTDVLYEAGFAAKDANTVKTGAPYGIQDDKPGFFDRVFDSVTGVFSGPGKPGADDSTAGK